MLAILSILITLFIGLGTVYVVLQVWNNLDESK